MGYSLYVKSQIRRSLPRCRDDGTSIVSSGDLKGMSLSSLILKYEDKLVGVKTFNEFGTQFPLLIKIIDANENLSVQVHPDDAYARGNGKNELWYILDAKYHAKIVFGIRAGETKEAFIKSISDNNVGQALNIVDASAGDAFYVPAGKVHAILSGVLVAEIQQNSNTTYRIYDWDRVDLNGKGRTLNTIKALDVIDFNSQNEQERCPQIANNSDYNIDVVVRSKYFNIDRINVHDCFINSTVSSFIILMCIKGNGIIVYDGGTCSIIFGETIFLPACIGKFTIEGTMTLLSIYMQ